MKVLRKKLQKMGAQGFTLVELMVVVAIIGILSAVAIPNFKKYQAKSKTSEAKLQLASLYTAQSAFQSDFDTFATCLSDMGFDPGPANVRYYAVGFNASNGTANGYAVSNGASSCSSTHFFAGGKYVGGQLATTVGSAAAIVTSGGATFTAAAQGYISVDFAQQGSADIWFIDQDKILSHNTVGY